MSLKSVIVIFSVYCATFCSAGDIQCNNDNVPSEFAKLSDCCPIITENDKQEEVAYKNCANMTDRCALLSCVHMQFDVGFNNATGMVDKDKYQKYILSKNRTADVSKMVTDVIDECFAKPDDDPCKLIGFVGCVFSNGVKRCPSTKIWNLKKMKECDVIKSYVEQCNI